MSSLFSACCPAALCRTTLTSLRRREKLQNTFEQFTAHGYSSCLSAIPASPSHPSERIVFLLPLSPPVRLLSLIERGREASCSPSLLPIRGNVLRLSNELISSNELKTLRRCSCVKKRQVEDEGGLGDKTRNTCKIKENSRAVGEKSFLRSEWGDLLFTAPTFLTILSLYLQLACSQQQH